MPGGVIFIFLLLLGTFWTVFGMGIDGESVSGKFNTQVELQGRFGNSTDIVSVEWSKCSATNSSKKMILRVVMSSNNYTCIHHCGNIEFNIVNMSLNLVHLKPEDEGIYEEKTIFKNGTMKSYHFNVTLLPFPVAFNITKSSSPGSLTLECQTYGEFELLQWFRNGDPLPDEKRFSLGEKNKTLQVTNLTRFDDGMYTCQVSNEKEISAVHINVTGEIPDVNPFKMFPLNFLLPVGFSIISILVLFIILICICKHYECRKMEHPQIEEPVYNEPTFPQEESVSSNVEPLLVVYQDFIKSEDLYGAGQSEDFGYSTIPDVLPPSKST